MYEDHRLPGLEHDAIVRLRCAQKSIDRYQVRVFANPHVVDRNRRQPERENVADYRRLAVRRYAVGYACRRYPAGAGTYSVELLGLRAGAVRGPSANDQSVGVAA